MCLSRALFIVFHWSTASLAQCLNYYSLMISGYSCSSSVISWLFLPFAVTYEFSDQLIKFHEDFFWDFDLGFYCIYILEWGLVLFWLWH